MGTTMDLPVVGCEGAKWDWMRDEKAREVFDAVRPRAELVKYSGYQQYAYVLRVGLKGLFTHKWVRLEY